MRYWHSVYMMYIVCIYIYIYIYTLYKRYSYIVRWQCDNIFCSLFSINYSGNHFSILFCSLFLFIIHHHYPLILYHDMTVYSRDLSVYPPIPYSPKNLLWLYSEFFFGVCLHLGVWGIWSTTIICSKNFIHAINISQLYIPVIVIPYS